jgi:hypothetical protein
VPPPSGGGGYYVKLEDLINRTYGLGIREKEAIFEYIRNGEARAKTRKDYITNMIIIFNSFFEYGFISKARATANHSSTSHSNGDSSSYYSK